jgi:hypothetical protein
MKALFVNPFDNVVDGNEDGVIDPITVNKDTSAHAKSGGSKTEPNKDMKDTYGVHNEE